MSPRRLLVDTDVWGAELDPRTAPLHHRYARLRTACRRAGHPLHNRTHAADLWVAASALAHQLPLVSDDNVFANVPGPTLIIEPA